MTECLTTEQFVQHAQLLRIIRGPCASPQLHHTVHQHAFPVSHTSLHCAVAHREFPLASLEDHSNHGKDLLGGLDGFLDVRVRVRE